MALFRKKSQLPEDEIKRNNKRLISENKKIKEDIEYLESQYTPYFLSSLTQDFEDFDKKINGIGGSSNMAWKISNIERTIFQLEKTLSNNSSYGERLKLDITHNGKMDDGFVISSIKATSNGNTITLDATQFKDIIFKYILTKAIRMSKGELQQSKSSFNFMLKVIGTDTHRDVKIDEILK